MVFADIVGIVEAKSALTLVVRDRSGNLENVAVESAANIVEIGEDECLVEVEPTSNNVLGVFIGKFVNFIEFELGLHQKLFVVRQLNDQGAVKDLLQPGSKGKGNLVTHVHGAAGRSTTGVKVEWLALLITVENVVEVPVGEEGFPSQKTMSPVTGETLEPL